MEKGWKIEAPSGSDGEAPPAADPPPLLRRGQAGPPLGRTLTRSASLKKAEVILPKARQGTVFSATAHIVTAGARCCSGACRAGTTVACWSNVRLPLLL